MNANCEEFSIIAKAVCRSNQYLSTAEIPKSIRCYYSNEHVLNANERELLLKTGCELIVIGQSKFRFILV